MFRTIHRFHRRLALGLAFVGLGLSASAGAESAGWVIQDSDQARDLYLDGQLTDREGRRWEVGIVPGARHTFTEAVDEFAEGGQRFRRAGGALADYASGDFWRDRGILVIDGLEFAGDAAEFGYEGIPASLGDTRQEVSKLVEEQPFAWAPRALWRGTTGVVVEPPLRAAAGTFGVAGGVGYAVAAPVVASTRPLWEATGQVAHGILIDGMIEGLVVPVAKLTWHQPAYLLAVMGPEPTTPQHGHFGLRIVSQGR